MLVAGALEVAENRPATTGAPVGEMLGEMLTELTGVEKFTPGMLADVRLSDLENQSREG